MGGRRQRRKLDWSNAKTATFDEFVDACEVKFGFMISNYGYHVCQASKETNMFVVEYCKDKKRIKIKYDPREFQYDVKYMDEGGEVYLVDYIKYKLKRQILRVDTRNITEVSVERAMEVAAEFVKRNARNVLS